MAVNDAYQAGLRYLARREHSEAELARKLRAKGFLEDEIQAALSDLIAENLLSNARFVENYTRYRLNSGWGPVTIEQELIAKGVPQTMIDAQITAHAADWVQSAKQVRVKKFGATAPRDFAEKAKQMRFLQYRGFSSAHIQHAFDPLESQIA